MAGSQQEEKVLIISNNRVYGGSEVLWIRLAHLLLQQGYTIGISVFKWTKTPDALQQLIKNPKVTFFYRQEPRFSLRIFNKLHKFFTNDMPVWKSFRPQLAIISLGSHVKTWRQPYYCRRTNVPYMLIFQLVNEKSNEAEANYTLDIQGAWIKYFASGQNQHLLTRQLAEDITNAKVINNSFQVNFEIPFEWPQQSVPLRMAVVSRLDAFHKGLDMLMEVLAAEKWKARDIEVNIYGEGPSKEYLIKLQAFYKLPNVKFLGHAESVASIWAHNHCLVLPSRQEGMSLALIEAMLCGRVPIVTDVGGACELIEPGVSGFIADAPITTSIDRAMEEAWNQRHRWPEIGRAAYDAVRSVIKEKPENIIARDVNLFFTKNS